MPSLSLAGLIVHSETPLNAEPPLGVLRAYFITPQDRFYLRSHGEVPRLRAAHYRLRVGGNVSTPLNLSLRDLKERFARRTVTAVLQCAGNRRADLQAVRPTTGDPWAPGAIGNARWTGVALADVLRAAGASSGADMHVPLDADDLVAVEQGTPNRFGVSVPMAKALSPEVLLAWAMNGEDLSPEHGYPLRAVVPGYAGVRSAKWLTSVTVQDRPSDNAMQQRDYKLLPSDVTPEAIDWSRGVTINEMPLNAAICEPGHGAALPAGRTTVRGYAVASGRSIARVDVSGDGGRTWVQAALEPGEDVLWSWTFWHAALDLAPGERDLVARAWDSAGQTQPATPDEVWNCKGYLCASWHRVRVRVGA